MSRDDSKERVSVVFKISRAESPPQKLIHSLFVSIKRVKARRIDFLLPLGEKAEQLIHSGKRKTTCEEVFTFAGFRIQVKMSVSSLITTNYPTLTVL